jgi:hypothetical protein
MLEVSSAGFFSDKPVLKFTPVAWITFDATLPNFVHRGIIGFVELNG